MVKVQAAVCFVMCMWLMLLWAACASAQSVDEWQLVQTAQGPVRGRIDPEGGVYAFYSIPYASVPTGRDRFKAPLAPPVWTQPYDAVDSNILCIQALPIPGQREDCLVASVFVPSTDVNNLPVVINVHGGGYQVGSANFESFKALVRTNKVIVVTFNYRLGVHGFLCLGTERAPGNAGIKDQVALLRWVNQNIASFGGNPDDVTLVACSAGAASVDVLTLSSITNGLYKRAIVESGLSFGGVGLQLDPVENAKVYANLLNFTNVDDINALEEFYLTASFELLMSHSDVITGSKSSTILFAPCVEKNVGQERVLTDAPINIIKTGNYSKVPLIYGFSNMEGLVRISEFETWKSNMNEKFSDFLPAELQFENDDDKEEVAKIVKEFYFGDQPVSEDNVLAYIDYFTDVFYAYPILRGIKLRVESLNDTIYLHEYSYWDDNTPSLAYTDERGANHCDQVFAVMDEDKTNSTEEYKQMKDIMRELWLNFILTGTPVPEGSQLPEWPPARAVGSPHMSLGREVQLRGILNEERTALWDSIYERHYRTPIPPSIGVDPSPDGASTFAISSSLLTCLLLFYYKLL